MSTAEESKVERLLKPPTPLLAAAERYRSAVTELLGDLIHTPSLSADEADVIEHLRQQMACLGYDETVIDPFGSVIGRIGSGPTTIVYDAHVDTVGVGSRNEWSGDPYEPRVSGGVMHGRGACDDKGGIAAMVMGGALYKELCPTDEVTLYVVGSVQEEDCDGLALEHLLTSVLPRPDLVVLGEATNGGVFRGHRGRIEVLVRTRGSTCHASAPGRGRNPIYDLAPIIGQVQELNGKLGWDDFLGAGTIAITKVLCETPSLNAIPSTSTLYIDRRLTVGEDPDRALEEIRDLPAIRAAGAEVELLTYDRTSFTGMTLGMAKQYPTWVLPEYDDAVKAGIVAGETALGRTPSSGHWVFSTNGVASMGKLGIPTIGYGPGNEVYAHTVADQCSIDDLVDSMAWYAGFPKTYMSLQTRAETT
jgi:putative selenium metabolism hydrolase